MGMMAQLKAVICVAMNVAHRHTISTEGLYLTCQSAFHIKRNEAFSKHVLLNLILMRYEHEMYHLYIFFGDKLQVKISWPYEICLILFYQITLFPC